jgi:voltage-gated potassium channel
MKASIADRILDRFAPMVVGLIVVPCVGVLGYRLIEGWSWIDALYMTVTTLSTVGYGEVHPLSPAGRIFTMGLIVSGGAMLAYALSHLIHFLFAGEWREHWENQRRLRMLNQLNNHFIVCGHGRVGRSVARELRTEGLPFVVIDQNPEVTARLRTEGTLAVTGDAAQESQLREAGIDRARGLIASAHSDAENVFIVLTARSLRPGLSIVARADAEESEAKLLRAGANRVILPYHITGRRLVTMVVRPDVADFLDEVSHASGLELLVEQVRIATESPLAGMTLGEAQSRYGLDITVLACKLPSGGIIMRPRGDLVLEPGCQLIALSTMDRLREIGRLADPSPPSQ